MIKSNNKILSPSSDKKIESGDLASIWAEIEPVLDQGVSDGSVDLSSNLYQTLNKKTDTGLSASYLQIQRNADMLEQGIVGTAPDVLDLVADPQPDLDSGVLLSKYRIQRPLGNGGMGDVYLAERADGQVNMQVALKILSIGLGGPQFLARFQRERQILAELNHPGIASLLDAGITEDGRPWFVLDYIQGEPLIDFCKHNSLTLQERLIIFQKLCEAIEYAHECGVVHRDLKPSNILVEKTAVGPKPIVLDFGIAAKREDENLTYTGQMLGTALYSSPEQIKGETANLDHRSDIFSLGILLYELVDNRRPFDGKNITETSHQIIHRDTPRLCSANIPKDLSAIIFKCLNKLASERYQSVSELITDLKNYKLGRSVIAHPVGPVYMLKRWVRRRPYLSTAISLTVLLMTVLVSVAIWQSWSKYEFASNQALITQRFGQIAREIESGTQLVYSRPLHNIEHDLSGFEQKYKRLKQEVTEINATSQHIAYYALGRAALGIGHNQEALQFLKIAWDSGFRDSVLALRLGQAYMRNYADSLQKLSLLSYSEAQTRALLNARQDYLEPARQFLQTGSSAVHEDAVIAKALVLHLNNDTASALSLLSEAAEKSPWPVDAMIESGNLYLEIAEKNLLEGNHSPARDALFNAEGIFRETANIARSHPAAIKGWCVVMTKMIQMGELSVINESTNKLKSIEPCDSLTILRPHSADFFVHSGMAYLSAARHIRNRSDDPEAALDRASEMVKTALQQDSQHPQALSLLGSIQMTRSLWIYETGGDGATALASAVEALDKAADLTPGDSELIEELSMALQTVGQMEYSNGGDGDAAFSTANKLLRNALDQPETRISSLLLLSDSLTWQAYYLYNSGKDAENQLQEAILAAEQVLEKSPEHIKAIEILAMALSTSMEFIFLKGGDPGELAARAFSYYQQSIESNPENHTNRFNQLYPLSLAIDYSLDQGRSQRQQLAKMHQLILELQKRLDNAHESNLLWADYWRYKAKQKVLDDKDPGIEILAARAFLKKSMDSIIDRYETVQSFAALVVFDHSWRDRVGDMDLTQFKNDVEFISVTIDEYPGLPILRLWRGRLMLLSETLDNDEKLKAAKDDFTSALQKNPLLGNRHSVFYESADAALLR